MDLRELYKTDHGDLSSLDILLIEKDGDESDRIKNLLADCAKEYTITCSETLDRAIELIHTGYIDVVLVDLSLTGGDSLERLIKPAIDLNKPYAIIALVGERDELRGIAATRSGAEDYIIKEHVDSTRLKKSIQHSLKCLHLRQRNINLLLIDSLTGLFTKRGFLMLADQQLKVAKRYKRQMFLLFTEAIGIMEKKEELGAVWFEKRLRETATILRHSFRGADILSSFGDGRFAGLAVGAPVDSSETIHSRLMENLRRSNDENKFGAKLKLNTQIVLFDPEYPQSLDELMEEAHAMAIKDK